MLAEQLLLALFVLMLGLPDIAAPTSVFYLPARGGNTGREDKAGHRPCLLNGVDEVSMRRTKALRAQNRSLHLGTIPMAAAAYIL